MSMAKAVATRAQTQHSPPARVASATRATSPVSRSPAPFPNEAALGNQALQRLLRSHAVQGKLTVNPPNDRYEQEADRMAQTVTRMPDSDLDSEQATASSIQQRPLAAQITLLAQCQEAYEEDEETETAQTTAILQRQEASSEEEEDAIQPSLSIRRQEEQEEDEEIAQTKPLLQRQDAAAEEEDEIVQGETSPQRQEDPSEEEEETGQMSALQRQTREGGSQDEEEEDETAQTRLFLQRQQDDEEEEPAQARPTKGGTKPMSPRRVSPEVAAEIRSGRGRGQPLDRASRSQLEPAFGADFSEVLVHTNPDAARLNRSLNAQAFTVGRDIYFGSGKFAPSSTPGRHLLAHELTHVVQQGAAREKTRGPVAGRVVRRLQRDWLGDIGGAIGGAFKAGVRVVKSAAKGVVKAVSKGLDWVIGKLAPLAHKIPGYKLLTLILGRDPITKNKVARNATNLIGGLLQLVGADDLFKSLEKSGAIEKAYKWLQTELAKLDLGWDTIKAIVSEALDSFSITDIANIPKAIAKLERIFGPPIKRIARFAKAVSTQIVRFIIQGVLTLAGPLGKKLWSLIQRGRGVIAVILSDPLRFLGNVFKAVREGFSLFGQRIWFHLKNALMGWLFGTLQGAGLELPEKLDFKGIVSLLLQIFGLTYANLRIRLVRKLGEKRVGYLEKAFSFLKILLTEGLAGAWKRILAYVGSLPDMLISAVRSFIIDKIVKAAVTKLATMFNPAGLIAQGLIALYNTVMFLIERFQQMLQLAESILQSVESIAAGKINKAAQFVEKTLGRLLGLVISFLARITIGDVVGPLKKAIKTLQAPVLRAMDKLVDFVAKKAAPSAKTAEGKTVKQLKDEAPKKPTKGEKKTDKKAKWERGIKVVRKALAHAKKTGIGAKELNAILKSIRKQKQYGFKKLHATTDPKDSTRWSVQGEINPSGELESIPNSGGVSYPTPKKLKDAARFKKPTYPVESVGDRERAKGPFGHIAKIKDGEERDPFGSISKFGYQPGDHRGHLIGDRFGGPATQGNLVPMASKLNLSTFKSFENAAAKTFRDAETGNAGRSTDTGKKRSALLFMSVKPMYAKSAPDDTASFRPKSVVAKGRVITGYMVKDKVVLDKAIDVYKDKVFPNPGSGEPETANLSSDSAAYIAHVGEISDEEATALVVDRKSRKLSRTADQDRLARPYQAWSDLYEVEDLPRRAANKLKKSPHVKLF
jgi:hypothetical protein